MEKWIELGKEFGLKEKELLDFVKDQQEIERRKVDDDRQERQRERDIKKLESEERERIYLRERDPENLDEAAKVAEQFLIAHGKKLHSPSKPPKGKYPPSGSTGSEKGGKPGGRMQCFTCGEVWP